MDKNDTQKIIYSGLAGSLAGITQLSSLYWLRTMIKYQYVHNTNLQSTWNILYHNPDKYRLYRGFMPNSFKIGIGKIGEASLITYFRPTQNNSSILWNSMASSVCITGWKLTLMPFDNLGNSYQVSGQDAKNIMLEKIKKYGYQTLWNGTMAYSGISFINNCIWITTYNYLNTYLRRDINFDMRNGLIGLSSSLCSDIIINPLRVIKTNKQTNPKNITYISIIKQKIIKEKKYFAGFKGRMIFNCFNSALYVILWKRLDSIIST